MSLPSLSVVIPNYNHAHRLPQALNAILDQSIRAEEIIVIDDASTDNSVDVISQFIKQDSSIKLILNEKNLGTELSNLKGLANATCDYIIFSGADDYYLPGFFEKALILFAKYPEAGLSSALCRRINENDDYIDTVPEPPYISGSSIYTSPQEMQDIFANTEKGDMMTLTTIYNRKLLIELNAYSVDSGKFVDFFSVALMAVTYGVCFIPEELGVFRLDSGSSSSGARSEPKIFLEYVTPMWKLMETTYASNFPPEVRKGFKQRFQYTYGAISLDKLGRAQRRFLEEVTVLFDEPTFMDRMFFFVTRLLGKIQFLATKGYLFLRLRRVGWDIVVRIFHRHKKQH